MDRQGSSIKKTTRPVLPKVIPRKRLFRILDKRRHHTVTWISGMAGSGKTTLAGSYLDHRGLPCLWYQFDERDGDPAAFFYYMGIAAQNALPKKNRTLPFFTGEYHLGASAFSRHYFELLCTRLPGPFFLVFDDYHTIPLNTPFHEIFRNGISGITHELHVIILSRNEPPPPFTGLLADNSMRIIGNNDLLMDQEESRKILKNQSKGRITGNLADLIHERTKGWAAGLILMAKAPLPDDLSPDDFDASTPEKTFDYFAGELFDKAHEDTRNFLVKTAFLPRMTADMADALAGQDNSKKMLASLERSHMFTEKLHSSPPTYQYHPLFRDFLLSTADKRLAPKEINIIRQRAASILADSGYTEEAAELYIKVNDEAGIIRLVEEHGNTLIEQGRGVTISQWIASIPEETLGHNPWALFWSAASCMHTSSALARDAFERAFRAFNENLDMSWIYLSWCGVIESTIYEWNDFTVLDPWIQWMDNHLHGGHEYPSPEIEARVSLNMMCAPHVQTSGS